MVPQSCCRSNARTGCRFRCEPRRAVTGRANWNLSLTRQTPWQSANRRRDPKHVHARLQNRDHYASAAVDQPFFARALPVDVLLQLLVAVCVADYRSLLESGKLSPTTQRGGVLADPLAIHVDRGAGDAIFSSARVSACLLPVVSGRCPQGPVLSARHHSPMGELSRARLRVENDSWQ